MIFVNHCTKQIKTRVDTCSIPRNNKIHLSIILWLYISNSTILGEYNI